jgi:hypothetical protein
MSTASFYKWRAKYDGMDVSMIGQMKSLEDENRRLKKMHARDEHAKRPRYRLSPPLPLTRPARLCISPLATPLVDTGECIAARVHIRYERDTDETGFTLNRRKPPCLVSRNTLLRSPRWRGVRTPSVREMWITLAQFIKVDRPTMIGHRAK